MIHLTIDDRAVEVPAGYTLLQAARAYGMEIPTLCYHEALEPYGACRLCLVELVGPRARKLVASCAYPCEPDLVVRTQSELVMQARRTVVQLLMLTSAHVPVVRELAEALDIELPRAALEPDDCILCGLCVRECQSIVGVGAIGFANRGMQRRVTSPFQVSSARCIECATCAYICPTGAIKLDQITQPVHSSHAWESPYIRRACQLCEYTEIIEPQTS